MQIGVTTSLLNACDNKAIRVVDKLSSLGFDYIELVSRTPKSVDIDKLGRVLKQHNTMIHSVCAWCDYTFQNPAHENPYVRKAYVDYVKDLVDLASNINAEVVVSSAGTTNIDRDEAYQYCSESLRELGGYASSHGVRIAVEAVNRYVTNFINNVNQALELISIVDHPSIGITLDTFHMNVEEASNEDAIRKAGKALFHLHFADNNRRAPGMGNIDFEKIANALKVIAYAGTVCLEIQAQNPEEEAKTGLALIRDIVSI